MGKKKKKKGEEEDSDDDKKKKKKKKSKKAKKEKSAKAAAAADSDDDEGGASAAMKELVADDAEALEDAMEKVTPLVQSYMERVRSGADGADERKALMATVNNAIVNGGFPLKG